jgi:hypothetical protein
MYSLGLQYLGKLQDGQLADLTKVMMDKNNTNSYWYWDMSADKAIYA